MEDKSTCRWPVPFPPCPHPTCSSAVDSGQLMLRCALSADGWPHPVIPFLSSPLIWHSLYLPLLSFCKKLKRNSQSPQILQRPGHGNLTWQLGFGRAGLKSWLSFAEKGPELCGQHDSPRGVLPLVLALSTSECRGSSRINMEYTMEESKGTP